jgi:hypothetical protein
MQTNHGTHPMRQAQRPGARTGGLPRARARGTLVAAAALAVAASALLAGPAAAAKAKPDDDNGTNPHVWKPRTTSVAVFKNGLGFFLREGKVQLREGWCTAERVPPATFGTLAIYSLDGKQLVDVVGSGPGEVVEFDGTDAPKDLATRRRRLEASKNLRVELTYKYKGSQRKAAGRLVSVGPEFVVLETDASSFAVPLEGVRKLQVLDLPLRAHVLAEAPGGAQKDAAGEVSLGMAYLRKGVTWIPEYTLKVLDETTAELTLRGTLVNEAEDLIHCDVNFVVGVPHFLHTNYLAPIAVGQVIRTIGTAVAPRQIRSQIMNRAAIAQNTGAVARLDAVVERRVAPAGGDLNKAIGSLPQLGGAAGTDYTVYTKRDLTVRRGEKAIVTLFVKRITYSHIYKWQPPEKLQHFLLLHNETDTPWTTGPCLAVSGAKPLSEDLLKYTPKGAKGELPVTAAVNIARDQSESEIDRKLKAHSPRPNYYLDLVTLEGKLKLRNYEKRDVTIVIVQKVPGRPTYASDDGKLAVDTKKLRLTERAGSVSWRIILKPGQEKTLTYKYERYVSSH